MIIEVDRSVALFMIVFMPKSDDGFCHRIIGNRLKQ